MKPRDRVPARISRPLPSAASVALALGTIGPLAQGHGHGSARQARTRDLDAGAEAGLSNAADAGSDAGESTTTGRLLLAVSPALAENAQLTIDGVGHPIGPPIDLPAGTHRLALTTADGGVAEREILLVAGETKTETFEGCPIHRDRVLGGAPPREEEVHGGCCGTTSTSRSALDIRILTTAVASVVVALGRRRRRRCSDETDAPASDESNGSS